MKKRVLIVEDDQVQIKFFEKIVSQVAVNSVMVNSGNEALEYLKYNNDIGLVLLDLALSDMHGLEVLEKIKELNNQLVVAILSASEDSKVVLKAGQLGAAEFFVKGSDTKELMRLFEFIHNVINQ
ncbi:MAG: response regulator [Pelagibacterales bacterium]|nr:response regulator [Pelagibacterales bacterium]